MYSFKEQLDKGEKAEQELDNFFSQWYGIQKVGMVQQRNGIDRIFTRIDNGHVSRVEYKTDWTAGKTHNCFVETVSVDRDNKPGWAHSSQADYLIYYIPGDGLAYIIEFKKLRTKLDSWKNFPTRKIPNKGYNTIGILVPQNEFEKISIEVACI